MLSTENPRVSGSIPFLGISFCPGLQPSAKDTFRTALIVEALQRHSLKSLINKSSQPLPPERDHIFGIAVPILCL